MVGFSHIADLMAEQSPAKIFLLILVAGLYLSRFFWDLVMCRYFFLKKKAPANPEKPSFSVLMAIRNEASNLKNNLPSLLSSEYPHYEVVVVDDFSQDQSFSILGLTRAKYRHLRLSGLNQEIRYSTKQALNIGVKAAENDWIILTDPSVANYPAGWLFSFAERTGGSHNLIVGYTGITPGKGWLHRLYRNELFFQQFQSFAWIACRMGFVAEETNLAFLKKKYFDTRGFAGAMNDLYQNMERVVNAFISAKKTTVNLSQEGVIRKNPGITREAFRERILKSIHIKRKLPFVKRWMLLMDDLTRLLIVPLTLLTLFSFREIILMLIPIILLKIVLHSTLLFYIQKRLNEEKIFLSSLLYELIIPYYRILFLRHYVGSL